MITAERPVIDFSMFGTDKESLFLVANATEDFFGTQIYEGLRKDLKEQTFTKDRKINEEVNNLKKLDFIDQQKLMDLENQKNIAPKATEELKMEVDRRVYDWVGRRFGCFDDPKDCVKLWEDAYKAAIATHEYERGVYLANQEMTASLTTNSTWLDYRPSSALELLVMPKRFVGEQLKYEQGLLLGMSLLCAEIISKDENGEARKKLQEINNFLEENFFQGRKGDPKNRGFYSYHSPGTNKLVDLSEEKPQSGIKNLFVKTLTYPVRTLRLKDSEKAIEVFYDPREKKIPSSVMKAQQRSLLAARSNGSRGVIETLPYSDDKYGFKLVVMQGGHARRDMVADNLVSLFRDRKDIIEIRSDHQANPENGDEDRFLCKRWKIFMVGLDSPFEVMVQSVEDHITQEYEVGTYDFQLGMHNGLAHDLYKLKTFYPLADRIWPTKIFDIDHKEALRKATYWYARDLRARQVDHSMRCYRNFEYESTSVI